MNKAGILLVDDHPIVRHGLARLIQLEDDLTVCGEAGNAGEALAAIPRLQPDIVLVDLVLDDEIDGFELIGRIKALDPQLPVLVLTMHDAADYLRRALQAGAQGFVNKKEAVHVLASAIRRVMGGHIYIGPDMMDQLAMVLAVEPNAESSPVSELSEREVEVLRLLGNGYRPRQVADELHVSPKTVHSHRENLKRKLNLPTASDLDRFAIRWVRDERLN